jgi:hypothetical protein
MRVVDTTEFTVINQAITDITEFTVIMAIMDTTVIKAAGIT